MSALFSLPHIEPSNKRIRVLFGGHYIVDTTKASLVWLHADWPWYFFKAEDVQTKYLAKTSASAQHQAYDIVVGDRKAKGAVKEYLEGDLRGLFFIDFDAADAWFEEDEQILVHPKDPYKRADVLLTSRHIRIEMDGIEVANTKRARLLFESTLPVRTYIPKTDCRLDILVPSQLTTQCPYKGVANYYHVRLPGGRVLEDSVWWHRNPQPESTEIKGLVAFEDEKFDVYVDGVLQAKP